MHLELELLHKKLRNEMKKKWKRILPFDELLFDRWEKAKYVKAGKKSSIYENSYIYGNVSIGKNTWIGPFTLLDGSGGKLTIGDNCSISSGVQIYTHNSVNWALTGGRANYEKKPVKIESCCYLGPSTIVTMGSRVGKCSIIGAHSLVNSKIPPYSIAYGIPAKVKGKTQVRGKNVSYEYF